MVCNHTSMHALTPHIHTPPSPHTHAHTLSHTGTVMESLTWELLNLQVCTNFIPRHARNLANEFCCYSNYKTSLDSSPEVETKKTDPASDWQQCHIILVDTSHSQNWYFQAVQCCSFGNSLTMSHELNFHFFKFDLLKLEVYIIFFVNLYTYCKCVSVDRHSVLLLLTFFGPPN